MTEPANQMLNDLMNLSIKNLSSIINMYINPGGASPGQAEALPGTAGRVARTEEYLSIFTTARYAPVILAVCKLLQALNRLERFQWTGFELKHLCDWLVAEDDPHAVYHYISGPCKLNCAFCYQKGNPPELARLRKKPVLKEVQTRLRYYDEEKEKSLFHTEFYNNDEVFTFPNALDFLEKIRRKSKKKIFVNTNGRALTEDAIKRLSALFPIVLDFNAASLNPGIRQKMMGDPAPAATLEALPLLKKYNIPFALTIVAWPGIPAGDIAETVLKAGLLEPLSINIRLPGYSRCHPRGGFDWESRWRELVLLGKKLQDQTDIPILFWPSSYGDNMLNGCELRPRASVIKHSPAYRLGIRNGMILKKINGLTVNYRAEAVSLLGFLKDTRQERIQITWEDNGVEKNGWLKLPAYETGYRYPYTFFDADHPWGLIIAMDIPPAALKNMYKQIKEAGAQTVLLFTSRLMEPRFGKMDAQLNLRPPGVKLHTVIPENGFFGGSIIMGDLLVVDDYVAAAKKWFKSHGEPDLVLIPETAFTDWGRDLVGRHYYEIQQRLGVPVTLLTCAPIIY
jgi:pyruvate-formate lyase-activating enzyme